MFSPKSLDFGAKLPYVYSMIKIEKNENFSNWFNVFVGSFLIDQVSSKAKALSLANKLCISRNEKGFSLNGLPMVKGER
jgi:hypothetical protein